MLDSIVSSITVNTVLVGLLTGLFVYWIIKKFRMFKYNLPPGPTPLPLIGNLKKFKTEMLHEEIFEWSKQYGPVVKFYLGPILVVVVNDIDSAMEVLVKKGADFAGRVSSVSLNVFSEGGKDIAFGQYGPTWRLHRKMASKALRHYMLGEALEERVHKALSRTFEEMKKEEEPFDPESYFNFLLANILFGLCFGGTFEYNDPVLQKLIELDDELLYVFSGSGPPLEDFIPGLQYVWETKKMTMLKGFVGFMKTVFGQNFKEHVESFNKDNIRDFADTLILARQEAEADPDEADLDQLTDTHIIQTMKDIFFAGIDTSRFTLRFAVLHMAAYPEIQTKVQAEIDRVVGKNELPKLRHRPDLSYTEAVLHESMRLSTVVPTGVARKTTCDTSIGNYDIPKNTMVMINHWALHHDPSVWKDVDEFRPERFLDENGKLGPKPDNWLPFSAGRRVCLGESIAKPELHLIFASLMQRFMWRLPEGVKADFIPLGNAFGLYPKPHKFIVQRRT